MIYILLILSLLIGSILLIIYSSRCPPKEKLNWYQKEIIYEIDVETFYDSNQDAIGDIQGIQQKFDYLEKNLIKSILIRSTIFESNSLKLNPTIANETQFNNLIKIFNRKDMHIIIDLPITSTSDGLSWYGSNQFLKTKINVIKFVFLLLKNFVLLESMLVESIGYWLSILSNIWFITIRF